MPDASPAKWHRAHTTWFFETFLLTPHLAGYVSPDPRFGYLFNSYYETLGDRHPRVARGLLTRPTAGEVDAYRAYVDAAMARLLDDPPDGLEPLLDLGRHHEQQHQELLLTDMLHAFAQSVLRPAVLPGWVEERGTPGPTRFIEFRGGLTGIGHAGTGFCFDNETPRHQVLLTPYALASRLVRNAEWQAFIADGGYARPTLWMADGWERARQEGWQAPLYWRRDGDGWRQMGLGGEVVLDPEAPVRHVSWYEADAFARWAGARLPTEAELEAAADLLPEFVGHVWQWTGSAYLPYPGFAPVHGAIGEYNGKFMINQMVLRGGAATTPPGHARQSYRNFFHPEKRWQTTGLRLARS